MSGVARWGPRSRHLGVGRAMLRLLLLLALAHARHLPRVLYHQGNSEKELPECKEWTVCSKVDLYEARHPWLERQCRCPGRQRCPSGLDESDNHTLVDRTRLYKLCEPLRLLPKCKYFHDATWTLTTGPGNATEQRVFCHCPKNAVAYLIRRTPLPSGAVQYAFACSPQSRLRCERKEPCRLFTVRKRPERLDEVTTSTLCQCPRGYACPGHHGDGGVLPGKAYAGDHVRTFSGYCLPH